jgi:hypothetical protein
MKGAKSNFVGDRLALTLVFALSFMSYMTAELSPAFQVAPVAVFAVLVFAKLLWSDSILDILASLLEAEALIFVIFVSLLTLATSLSSNSENSFATAATISGCVVLARMYMVMVPVEEVLEAFFWSGIVSIGLLVLFGFSSLLESIQGSARFSPFSFHPNLLAFLAAGYFCAMVWKFMAGGWCMKIISGITGAICLVSIFFASSRGSIAGLVVGCCVVISVAFTRAKRERRLSVGAPLFVAVIVVGGSLMYFERSQQLQDAYDFTERVLAISDTNRGVDSGFTGRFDKWHATLNLLSDGSWLVGKGIRSSDAMTDNLIDNSYLVLLYEVGLIPLVLISWRYFDTTWRVLTGYARAPNPTTALFYLVCTMLLSVFLANNFVARFLFSVGNPFSLVALMLFAAPSSRLVPGLNVPERAREHYLTRLQNYS